MFDALFRNCPQKIKMMAKVNIVLGCISIIITSISVVIISAATEEGIVIAIGLLLSFIILIVGFLYLWLSSLLLVGFSEIIESNLKISKNTIHPTPMTSFNNDNNIKIEKLKKAYENGILTEEEYKEKRAKILIDI